jgi:hypothetical protein
MNSDDARIAAEFYQAAFSPQLWPKALDLLAHRLGAGGSGR